jgi:zinc protease
MKQTRFHRFLCFGALALALVSASAGAAPRIQHWVTGNGVRVYFVENHDLPLLDVSVEFDAGSSRDVPAKSGLAAMTRRMLPLGAGGVSEDEIAKRLADVGAELGGSFDQDRAGVSLRTLSSERERTESLGILARLLQQPDFPAAVLEREKARTVAALKEAETQPESIVQKAFAAAVYGTHPYALPPAGEVVPVGALRRQDVLEFYRTYYRPDRAVVAMIGDITKAQAQAVVEQLTGSLPRPTADIAALPAVAPLAAAETRKIPHPASQSHILIGQPGMKRDDPDYFPLFVGNYILGGGGFASRLIEQVREKRGLAYSVYSYFLPLRQEGPFEIGLQTKREQTDEALAVVRRTLADFVAKGPTPDELARAKQHLVGGFPLRIDSNRKILDYLAMIGFYRLPLTYLDDFVSRVERVTVADVKSAFARRVRPDRMVTVIVGGETAK